MMNHNISTIAWRSAVIYGLFGAIWIAVSDNIVAALFTDITIIREISIYKGWGFVILTAILLYYALRAQLYRWSIENKRRQFVETELVEKEMQYKLIAENVTDVIWVLDLDTSLFLYVSPSVEKLRGFTVAEVMSQTMNESISPSSAQYLSGVIPERIAEFTNGVIKSYTDEIEQPHKDGHVIFTETTTRFVKNSKSGHTEVYGATRDITKRKHVEDILRKSEERFHSAFDTMLEGSQILSHDWRYLYLNAAAERHNRRLNTDLIGKRYMDMWPGIESTNVFSEIKRCLEERTIAQMENKFVFPDGVVGWFNLSIQPIPEGILILSFDITERKKAEEALSSSEAKFRSYIEHAPLGVMITDKNGIYTELNPAAARMFGYTEHELVGRSINDILAPQSMEAGLRNFERLAVEGISFDEYQMIKKDGRNIWVFVEAVKLNDNSFLGFCQDTTIRKHFEGELQKLSMAVEQSPVTIMVTDVDGIIEYVNPIFTETSGYTFIDVAGKNVNILSALTTPQESYAEMWKTINSGNIWKGEFENRKKNGEIYKERATISPMKDKHGVITHFIAVKEDITGIMKTELMIQEQSLMLKQLFDGSPTATVLMDANRNIININDAFVSLFGYSRTELYGNNVNSLIIPESKIEEAEFLDNELLMNHDVHLFESIRKNKEGNEIEVLISGIPVISNNTIVNFYFMYLDISQQKLLQKQLIQSQKMEGIGTLAAGIAHDFNNILGIIIGYTSFLTSQQSNPEKFAHSIDTMLKAGERGASLVRQLLTFARKTTVKITSININDTIAELMKLLNETFPKSITIKTSLQSDLPFINADASQIHQVILNLCVNARDAMPKGGTLSISTVLIDEEMIDHPVPNVSFPYVKIQITDTGSGIPKEIRERIFEPFFTTKEIGKGTGLGLSVVFGIIENHQGTIFVDSEMGDGTTFTIYLPVPAAAISRRHHSKEFHGENIDGTETILIVEDEPLLNDLMVSFMESKKYHALSANDGQQAYSLFMNNKETISAVFTDYGLPGIDGLELARKILAEKPDVKIVIASGYLEPSVHQEIEHIQSVRFIQKPYQSVDVLKMIRKMFDKK